MPRGYATVLSDSKRRDQAGTRVVAMMEWWWHLVSLSGTGGITGRPEGGQWQKTSASFSRATQLHGYYGLGAIGDPWLHLTLLSTYTLRTIVLAIHKSR